MWAGPPGDLNGETLWGGAGGAWEWRLTLMGEQEGTRE